MVVFIKFTYAHVPFFLDKPATERTFRIAVSKGIGMNFYGSISRISVLVHKKIIISTHNMHVRCKAFSSKKQASCIGQVAANTHIWVSFKSRRQVVNARFQSFKTDKRI